MPLRDIVGKLGGPWATAPLGLLSMTWQLARELRALLDVGPDGVRGNQGKR